MSHLIDKLKDLKDSARRELLWWRHEGKLRRLVRTHPLRVLSFEVTRRCNLECAYCGSDCSNEKRANELSIEEWIGISRQMADDFDAKNIPVCVMGGEPLIKEGIIDLFKELGRLKFPYSMVTNGFMLTREMAKDVVDAGIGAIALSLDAPPELNDSLRGKGTTEKVANAVQNLKEAGFYGKLEIMSTVTALVVPHLAELRRFIAGLPVPLWRLALVMPIGRAASRPDLIPNDRELREVLEFIRSARQDSLMPKPEFCEECFLGNRFEGVVRPYLCQCLAGIVVGGIQSDGKIGACPELGPAFVQGDIRRERFKDVWEKKYQVFRDRSWTKKDDCAVCRHYPRCKGSGLHLYATPDSKLMRCLYNMAKRAEDFPINAREDRT